VGVGFWRVEEGIGKYWIVLSCLLGSILWFLHLDVVE
jgi:hypothetical protein